MRWTDFPNDRSRGDPSVNVVHFTPNTPRQWVERTSDGICGSAATRHQAEELRGSTVWRDFCRPVKAHCQAVSDSANERADANAGFRLLRIARMTVSFHLLQTLY